MAQNDCFADDNEDDDLAVKPNDGRTTSRCVVRILVPRVVRA
jgi:hypothetical protein